jgi:hypothetical protein
MQGGAMNRDEINRIILDNELFHGTMALGVVMDADHLEKFANLVAATEREACAKVCDEKVDAEYATGKVDHNEMGWTQACAAAIRARREQ